jgi:membrane protease YdiL (CAAX protease family)
MTTEIAISAIPEKVTYATSKTNPEQHSLPRSIALHLLPGILTGTAFFLIAPVTQRNGLPSLWAHGIADLFVILPFIYGVLFYAGYKRNGRLSLDGVVLYRERLPWWQYLVYVPVLVVAAAIFPLLAPVTNFIADRLFSWWPEMYQLSFDLRGYPPAIITATLIFNFLVVALLAPIAEEIYFRGYLLPRLSRFGFWAVPIHTTLFALFHVWTPWMFVARVIGIIPFAYIVQRKQNIYIGMIAHCFFNILDVLAAAMLVLG